MCLRAEWFEKISPNIPQVFVIAASNVAVHTDLLFNLYEGERFSLAESPVELDPVDRLISHHTCTFCYTIFWVVSATFWIYWCIFVVSLCYLSW